MSVFLNKHHCRQYISDIRALLIICSAKVMSKLSRKKLSREENLSLPRELVEGWGYEFESHEVITEDGYILNVHR